MKNNLYPKFENFLNRISLSALKQLLVFTALLFASNAHAHGDYGAVILFFLAFVIGAIVIAAGVAAVIAPPGTKLLWGLGILFGLPTATTSYVMSANAVGALKNASVAWAFVLIYVFLVLALYGFLIYLRVQFNKNKPEQVTEDLPTSDRPPFSFAYLIAFGLGVSVLLSIPFYWMLFTKDIAYFNWGILISIAFTATTIATVIGLALLRPWGWWLGVTLLVMKVLSTLGYTLMGTGWLMMVRNGSISLVGFAQQMIVFLLLGLLFLPQVRADFFSSPVDEGDQNENAQIQSTNPIE